MHDLDTRHLYNIWKESEMKRKIDFAAVMKERRKLKLEAFQPLEKKSVSP